MITKLIRSHLLRGDDVYKYYICKIYINNNGEYLFCRYDYKVKCNICYITADVNSFIKIDEKNIAFQDYRIRPKYLFPYGDLEKVLNKSKILFLNENDDKCDTKILDEFLAEILKYFNADEDDYLQEMNKAFSICYLSSSKILINMHYKWNKDDFTFKQLNVYLFECESQVL